MVTDCCNLKKKKIFGVCFWNVSFSRIFNLDISLSNGKCEMVGKQYIHFTYPLAVQWSDKVNKEIRLKVP